MLSFVYQAEFEADQALAHILIRRLVLTLDHHIVESIASQESSRQRLALDSHMLKVASLPDYKWLLIVVSLTTYRTEALLNSLVLLEALEVLQTVLVVHVAARQNRLIAKLQVLEADRAWFIYLGPLQEVLLNRAPLHLPEWHRWLVHEAQPLCQTQILDIPHSLFLDIVEGALLSHMPVVQDLLNVTATLCGGCTDCTASVASRGIIYRLGLTHDLKTNCLQILLSCRLALRSSVSRLIPGSSIHLCSPWFLVKRVYIADFELLHNMVLHSGSVDGLFLNVELSLI